MTNTDFFPVSIGLIVGGLLFLFWLKNEIRKDHYDYIMQRMDKIRLGTAEFSCFLKNESGYFNNYRLISWSDNYSYLVDEIKSRPFESIGLNIADVENIKKLIYFNTHGTSLRADYNRVFIPNELQQYSDFFKNVEKHGLDKDQQIAVVTDEDNNIVIAGAGSGKTTTIVGKVNYIIDKYKVSPQEILLISFTNKSATTLAERICFKGIEAKTFHKFGIDVVTNVEKKKPSIFDEQQFKPLITRFFKEQSEIKSYLLKVTTYFTDFLKPEKQQDDFQNQGEYIQYLKDYNFKSYKSKEIIHKGKTTLKMEVVKSIEECKIANFLLFNGVDYEYELPYEHDTATAYYKQYQPDFTINPKSNTLYLEHFALNKNQQVPAFFADEKKGETIEEATRKYNDGIKWKKQLHLSNKTSLIETYSHEMFDGTLYEKLTQRLSENGVQLFPKSPEEIWKIISESAQDEVNSFLTLFQTFITLMKSNNFKIFDLIEKNKNVKDEFQQKRNALFIEIITPIFNKYEQYLIERGEIDFSDMINRASKYIANQQFSKKISYVIIDEFQDISIGRYQLVMAIKKVNPSCKLFCVGDDWQSIYRFSGSDIALFKNFENYFGITVKSKIETTYRFHNPLINLSSEFILKNPNQAPKELKGANTLKSTSHKIVYSNNDNQDDTFALKQILEELLETNDYLTKEIYILGRYSFDINRIKNDPEIFQIDIDNGIIQYSKTDDEGKTKKIEAHFMTVHKAKGLEADFIIILNCNAGKHGFPSEMSDDSVLNLLLSEADQFENGEERRLFYVAMTRAKEIVYFVANSSYKSKFITELEIESPDITVKKCPKCIIADLVKYSGIKNGRAWAFYGCSNFKYGCIHKEWV